MTSTTYAIDLAAIRLAEAHLEGVAHRTPIATSRTLDARAEREVFLKCENFQRIGAFKFRGAYHAVASLSPHEAERGVVTHSSGNHAQALALAAKIRGIPAHVVMPSSASPVKRAAVQDYGARVIECEPTLAARESTAERVLDETGGILIPPFDHPHVIAGQATVATEIFAQVSDVDAIVAPVGGGGLVSGIALAMHFIAPYIRVFAAEPTGADDAARSKEAGEWLLQTAPDTIADGLLTSLGELTWPVVRDRVERVITVSDDEIVSAMHLVWERMKLVIEPSAATPVAAVLSPTFRELAGVRRVAVVVSGGNVDLSKLPFAS